MEIKVVGTEISKVLTRVEEFLSDNVRFYIVTPNPELILMSQENKNLKKALNSANLSIPDGVGLKVAIPGLKIIKGRELFLRLIKLAAEKDWKVFLLGGLDNEARLASDKLVTDKWKLKIESSAGPRLDENAIPISEEDRKLEKEAIEKINNFNPHLLFVAFGNPKQEIWVHKNLSKLKIGGAMCVGGTLRYIAGLSLLPPNWMSTLGLEWLWRLISEPKRIGRIFRAVIVFPVRCLLYKLNY